MRTGQEFVAVAERDAKVIKAMTQAREAMSLVALAAVEVQGVNARLNFLREIMNLTEALRLMGHPTD